MSGENDTPKAVEEVKAEEAGTSKLQSDDSTVEQDSMPAQKNNPKKK